MDIDSNTILATLRDEVELQDAELAAQFYILEDYYERKLWYQLSEVLKNDIYKNENSKSIRLRLFDRFILSFSEKINQLQLCEFLVLSLNDNSSITPQESSEYLTNLKERIHKLGEKKSHSSGDEDINDFEIIQSLIYLDNIIAKVKLELGFIDEVSNIIDSNENKIDNLTSTVDLRVNSSYYYIKSQLMKYKGDFNSFYHNCLLFLSYIPNLNELNNKESIVKDIAISGILGDKIYNFGEIIMHEIFQYLNNEWLKELVLSLNSGNLKKFEELINNDKEIKQLPDIINKIDFLKQKVCIMAFIELVFNKPTNNRCIKYEEILSNIPILNNEDREIEKLVMKSLSLKLIKGTINQVNKEVEITWMQPRTMTIEQITSMRDKMEIWKEKVSSLSDYMGNNGSELLV